SRRIAPGRARVRAPADEDSKSRETPGPALAPARLQRDAALGRAVADPRRERQFPVASATTAAETSASPVFFSNHINAIAGHLPAGTTLASRPATQFFSTDFEDE